jgi:NADH:ubiquinone oxidoreductase subunit 6 (subunit J)
MSRASFIGWTVTLAILGAVGLALHAAAQLYTPDGRAPRTMVLTNAPHIALVATLPRTPEFSGYDDKGEPIQLDLGYSYREISALWMPFAAFADHGLVLFSGSGETISIAPVTDIDRAAITKVAGSDLTTRYSFPYYAHIWGWLSVLVLAVVTWLLVKRAEWKRAKAGIM